MDTNYQSPVFFAISESGPFHQILSKLHLTKNKIKLVGLFLCITWLPLVIITAMEGTLYSRDQPSFLADVVMQVRLLVGLPLLLLIGTGIDNKVIEVKKYFSDTLMKDKEQQFILARILRGAWKMANSAIAEILLLLILIALTIGIGKGGLYYSEQGLSESWKLAGNNSNQELSLAAKWAYFISIPLYQFILLRWLWRYVVWAIMLFRLSFSRMSLLATHPDKAGGLGIIMLAQKYFCFIFVALSTVLSGELIAKLIKDPGSFTEIRGEGISYILICLLLVLIPPIFFARKLVTTKEEGLLKMSKLGTHLSKEFEREWINDIPVENKTKDAMVSTSDLQDYDTIYVSLEQLRMVPFTPQNIIALIILLLIPYLPILFIHYSVLELLQKISGILF